MDVDLENCEKTLDFLIDEVDDVTLSQICADMETEYHVFEGIQNLSFSENFNFDENEGLGESGSNLMEFDIGDLSSLMETECEVKKELKESTRFGPVVNDDELKCLVENQENKNTKSNTKWAVKVFESWREQRAGDIIELHLMDTKSMNHWLERFIVEARKKNGSEYPPKTLYLILYGLLRHLRQKGVYDKNFLDEKEIAFVGLRKVLDAKMKSLVDRGLGCEIRQADPIWPKDEEKLWQENVFGKENSEQLQHTMFFYSCKLFGLRACDEHHKLQCEQFSIGNDIHGQFIQFVGRASKTYKGGFGQMNLQTKNLKHYCEPGDRCLAEYFQIYLDALDGAGPFYRRPLPGTSEKPVRYGTQVVGINKLKTFMKSISKKGGLEGNYTNHSGKKTCATQLYIGGVPEAEIMNVTGHRSEQGVRKYMKSNVEMKKSISKILDPPMKQESQEPSSEQTTGGKRALSPCTTNRSEGDAKKLCSESNRALRDLTNTASVFQNCHFNFSFGSN
ncbi:uncharacterized protein LOC134247485 [Saccostrea cucullata]|uniref:uncharacterized protein LOC134247485 n=1 Tax=Saccostrea cuccullata TaxID=36930 RepID=UPI002ED4A1CB